MEKIKETIFAIDRNPITFEFVFENSYHLWPQVRYNFYMTLLNYDNPQYQRDRISVKQQNGFFRKLRMYKNLLVKSPYFKSGKYDLLVFSSSVGFIEGANGKHYSRIGNLFTHIDPQNVLNVIGYDENCYKKAYEKEYCLGGLLNIYAEKKAAIFQKHSDKEKQTIAAFIQYLSAYCQGVDLHHLTSYLENKIRIFKYELENVAFYMKSFAPKLVVIEDASYGSFSFEVRAFKEAGIKVAEVQHGVLDIAHDYDLSVQGNSIINKYRPDYFLTYGNYWSSGISPVSEFVPIGNYHLEQKKQALKHIQRKKQILIISQKSISEMLTGLSQELALHIARIGYELVFRPHPLENLKAPQFDELRQINIRISTKEDVYEELSQSEYVIGVYSTTLFEAGSFGATPLILKNFFSETFIPSSLGFWFSNVEECISLIESKVKIHEADISHYYANNWNQNLHNFLKEKIGWNQRT